MKKRNESWREYLSNKNATKNPKIFSLTFKRDKDGELYAIGGQAKMLSRQGTKEQWVKVNTRELAFLINNQGINAN